MSPVLGATLLRPAATGLPSVTQGPLAVSVIIPAHNAGETLAATLESLQAQTIAGWEAVVVDDGSRDSTAEVAAAFAAQDPRIRVVSQPNGGVSAARNAGIAAACFDWLLFLDADDWILPVTLEYLTGAVLADPGVDGAHCGWAMVAPDGTVAESDFCRASGDLFPAFANGCVFTIHACLIRRSVVEAVGGFDPSLTSCEDWDLWQRCARSGARWAAVPESLARYRMRPGSGSLNVRRMLHDGLRVMERGHVADPRVAHPLPTYAEGLPATNLDGTKLLAACWCAGLAIGSGADAAPLLAEVGKVHHPELHPNDVAATLFKAIPRAALLPLSRWGELWPQVQELLDRFLTALEEQSHTRGLKMHTRRALERLVLARPQGSLPVTLGTMHAIRLELTQPIPTVAQPAWVQRLLCVVEYAGERLGTLELPICDGLVPAPVLADAVVAEHAWAILGRFFEHSLAGSLEVRQEAGEFSLWRGPVCLARRLRGRPSYREIHNEIGWALFLQELWETPVVGRVPSVTARHGRVRVEASAPIPDLVAPAGALEVEFAVGGVLIGVIAVEVPARRLRAAQLREALEAASGFELCRAVVREAIVGAPPTDPDSLRGRLAAAAARRAGAAPAAGGVFARTALGGALPTADVAVVLARRGPAEIGTSASRWAMLPTAAAPCLLEAAAVSGEPVQAEPPRPGGSKRLVYAPDLFLDECAPAGTTLAAEGSCRPRPDQVASGAFSQKELRRALGAVPGLRRATQVRTRLLVWTQRRPARGRPGQRLCERELLAGGPAGSSGADAAIVDTTCDSLPILMYHRIAPAHPSGTTRFQVTPEQFEQQLCWLRDNGYAGITLEAWRAAVERRRALTGRVVLLTFDDGYRHFLSFAWPLLQRYGYPATIFLVADQIGRTNQWDADLDEEPLLDWEEILQLRDAGVQFGSHTASHPLLTTLDPAGIVREAARSRAVLQQHLGLPVHAIAYPYGDTDPVVQHLAGACGYRFGLTCGPERAYFHTSLLALPRFGVTGFDDLESFAARFRL